MPVAGNVKVSDNKTMRYSIVFIVLVLNLFTFLGGHFLSGVLYYLFIILVPVTFITFQDFLQTKQAIRRNYPLIGNLRYLLESIRPEIQQYFVESDDSGRPFNREMRSVVYQRAKAVTDTLPFGSKLDHYCESHEWINHSMAPLELPPELPRVTIGNKDCKQPYSASILNISAMSYGSLSAQAVESLNLGAKNGGFAHNTGEGGVSPYHLKHGGDLIWQIGTGYFGCRTTDGNFNPEMFKERVAEPSIKMVEIKLSQGAKPGHGGILPAGKVTKEIAEIRGVKVGKTVNSPPAHKTFSNPLGLIKFIQQLRELSGGKPVGIKLCLGRKSEFLAICKAMKELDTYPDFISVDGSEGGTGASPLEFSNSIGNPLNDALSFIHGSLVACEIRQHIKIIASGKITTGFDMLKKVALGADLCYSARAMMFALGCIQALRCNSNDCPAGVATQNKSLAAGLVIREKHPRITNYHRATIHSFYEMIAAAGIDHPSKVRPFHIQKRLNTRETKHYGEIYTFLKKGAYERKEAPPVWQKSWDKARTDAF